MSGFSKQITSYSIKRDLNDTSADKPYYVEIRYFLRYIYEKSPNSITQDWTNRDSKVAYFATEDEAKQWLTENGVTL